MLIPIRISSIAALIGLVFLSPQAVLAQSSIKVLVNDQPITSYDISQRSKLMRLAGVKGGEKAAIDELIDETLETYEGLKRGVKISDRRVDAAFSSIAEGLKMSPTQFTQALNSEGIESTSLKKRLRAQLVWQALVQARMQAGAAVKGSDVVAALASEGGVEGQTMTEVVLQQIIFVVPSGASAAQYAQRRREAVAFRQRFAGCDKSIEQAKQLRGVVVKDVGRRDSSQLQGAGGEAIKNTPAGRTVEPAQTDQGIELIAVCSKRDFQSNAAARVEVENKLFLEQNKDLGKDYLDELRKRAIIEYR
jgi:peptidyl-prolyl cis-trans isomerase SurA